MGVTLHTSGCTQAGCKPAPALEQLLLGVNLYRIEDDSGMIIMCQFIFVRI